MPMNNGEYTGATKTQIVRAATQLRLPADNAAAPSTSGAPTRSNSGVNVGLGLPESSTERVTNQASTGSTAREASVDPQNMNPMRRTTLPNDNNSNTVELNDNN